MTHDLPINVARARSIAAERLAASSVAEPTREAGLLLSYSVNRDAAFLIAHPEYELNKDELSVFNNAVERRASHEPFQYITGKQEFYGLDFVVTPDVLIPRPETEMLVERSIAILTGYDQPRFLEIGVGSGCIAISILKNCPHSFSVATDVSADALNVAHQNAIKHDVADRIDLPVSDVFSSIGSQAFDLIVSNPPYVPMADIEGLQHEVRDHEPTIALTDGANGLTIIEEIVTGSPDFLKPGGTLLLEIGFNQSESVSRRFHHTWWQNVAIEPDLQGIPRMVVAEYRGRGEL